MNLEERTFVKLTDLDFETIYQARAEKKVNTKFGPSYLIEVIIDKTPRLLWANKQLKEFLDDEGKVKFTLIVKSQYRSHSGYNCFKLDLEV